MRSFYLACGVAGSLLLAAAPVFAQTTSPAPARATSLKDGVYRKGGLTMRLQAGQTSRLSAPVTMANGLTIRPDGIMVSKDGTRQILEEGKAVNMQGQIVGFADDMMSAPAIEQRARQVAGVTETRVAMPDAGPVPARLALELLRTERRLALLQQLADKLAQRAGTATGQTAATAALDAQIRDLDAQLKR
ncbi:hypothetical protein SAMN02745146_0438 [Hymenobacter daecheongensis DSM 21074]|uniref:DUF6799 domain-containing protein n=1 Tax=Hymenobacter daecheongensis DSM 21074 TaxID=1121955 RepID=A0A1M6A0R7_9BACT|nr:DUF6799 domain-containing protein [Hymenobacter daecheongensis]SHI30091.1 hypothetical protein SAMN02745146_0438 [Hymenobacter daecheongensis DSM 21074]